MTPNSIKALIVLRGKEQKEIAEALNIEESDLTRTIKGIRSNPIIRRKLAQHLGMTVEEMFDAEFNAVVAHMKNEATA